MNKTGINLDIVLGKMPNNTEILVKNTYLDYNYSAYQDLKYAILNIKYYTKVSDNSRKYIHVKSTSKF